MKRNFFSLFMMLVALGAALAQEDTQTVSELIRSGNIFYSQGDCELAQIFFQEALRVEEANVEALIGRGKAMACQNNFQTAIEDFQKVVRADAQNVSAYVQLALAYKNQFESDPESYPTRLADALDIISSAERFATDSAEVANTKGIILYQLGNLEDARTTLERAVDLALSGGLGERERATIQINLGRVYRSVDELELARQAFRRAVALDPSNASAHNNLGNVYFQLGDCEEAEFQLRQAVSLAPNSLSPVQQLAVTLFECDQVAASVPYFERSLDFDTSVLFPALYTYLSRAYLQQGRFDDAVRRAQQGALLPPENAEAYFHLGQAYEARGNGTDGDAARRAYERSLEINSGFAPARDALARLP